MVVINLKDGGSGVALAVAGQVKGNQTPKLVGIDALSVTLSDGRAFSHLKGK